MTGMNDDNPYPDDMPVLVRFPRNQAEEQADREQWPWLAGVVVSRCQGQPPEWQVLVLAPELEDEDHCYPLVFRDASEIKPSLVLGANRH